MNADLVILSACNTAGPGGDGYSLSGLAQAFFFGGARSLLVSHWYVDSKATEELIKSTIMLLQKEPGIERSEALRRSIITMTDSGDERLAHPSKWAPFVVVGEGGAMR